jgi:hypothetical protein
VGWRGSTDDLRHGFLPKNQLSLDLAYNKMVHTAKCRHMANTTLGTANALLLSTFE